MIHLSSYVSDIWGSFVHVNAPRTVLVQNTNNVRQVEEITYIQTCFAKMNALCILPVDKKESQGEFGVDCAIRVRTIHFGVDYYNIHFLLLYLCFLRCDCNFDAKVNDVSLQKKRVRKKHLGKSKGKWNLFFFSINSRKLVQVSICLLGRLKYATKH